MAKKKGYITPEVYESFRAKYKECIRMLNGLEKTLERKLPQGERRWAVEEHPETYSENNELVDAGWPIPTDQVSGFGVRFQATEKLLNLKPGLD
jgi:hypothetical protein